MGKQGTGREREEGKVKVKGRIVGWQMGEGEGGRQGRSGQLSGGSAKKKNSPSPPPQFSAVYKITPREPL